MNGKTLGYSIAGTQEVSSKQRIKRFHAKVLHLSLTCKNVAKTDSSCLIATISSLLLEINGGKHQTLGFGQKQRDTLFAGILPIKILAGAPPPPDAPDDVVLRKVRRRCVRDDVNYYVTLSRQ